jgi:hypothetical protein
MWNWKAHPVWFRYIENPDHTGPGPSLSSRMNLEDFYFNDHKCCVTGQLAATTDLTWQTRRGAMWGRSGRQLPMSWLQWINWRHSRLMALLHLSSSTFQWGGRQVGASPGTRAFVVAKWWHRAIRPKSIWQYFQTRAALTMAMISWQQLVIFLMIRCELLNKTNEDYYQCRTCSFFWSTLAVATGMAR